LCGGSAATAFRRTSPPSGTAWRCTAASVARAPSAAPPSSGSCMPRTSATTVRAARPGDGSWRTAPCPACSRTTGRGRSRSWRTVLLLRVHRLDEIVVLLLDDATLDLERRCQFAAFLRQLLRQEPELLDRLVGRQ